jgi:hypothetical protein
MSCVTQGKSLYLSKPHIPKLSHKRNFLMKRFREIRELLGRLGN